MKREVVIVGMARTPIGKFMGSLSSLSGIELGEIAAREAMKRARLKPEDIDEVVTGVVYKHGLKGNPARQIQVAMNIPYSAAAVTVDQQCASGMRALEIGCQQILLGRSDGALICGIESMSNVPHMAMKSRKGARLGSMTLEDGLLYDALIDAFTGIHMGNTAENLAKEYGISREEQDQFALLSHQRALGAIKNGRLKDEMVPVEIKTRKGITMVDTDENPRETTLEELANMRPAFQKDGTVTAGNASSINDGGCAMVIMSGEKAESLGITPLARIRSTATVGVDPSIMGIGPVYAIPKAMEYAGVGKEDIQYYEINEAFAAQALSCIRALDLDLDSVNINGSGISLGHPVGSTGLKIVISAYYELLHSDRRIACSSLCAGGGPAMATIIERI